MMKAKTEEEKKKSLDLTWQELAQHNTKDDAWMAVRGQVYDVTSWLKSHPGGRDVLLLNAGRDATQLFEAYHAVWVHKMLERFWVGSLSHPSEHPTFPPMSQFYLTLKQKVEDHFKETRTKHNQGTVLVFASVFLVLATLLSYVGAVFTAQTSLLLGIALAAVSGAGSTLVSLVPVHEASHAALTSSPWAWRLMGATHDFINGCSFYMWCHQHFLGHHPYTNIGEVDPDVHTNDPDIRRIKPSQKWYNHYKLQHIYAPFLYGLLATKFRLNDIQIMFFLGKNGKIRVNPTGYWHWAIFILGKLFWVLHRIVLPSFYLPLGHVLALVMAADLVASYYLALVFQVNHVASPAIWPKVNDKAGTVDMDWAKLQVMTTIDYAHGSWLTTFLTGALNYQVVHHLFPNISQVHYPQLAPIVREVCKEFDVPYVVLPSFRAALSAHINYLMTMGGAKHLDEF